MHERRTEGAHGSAAAPDGRASGAAPARCPATSTYIDLHPLKHILNSSWSKTWILRVFKTSGPFVEGKEARAVMQGPGLSPGTPERPAHPPPLPGSWSLLRVPGAHAVSPTPSSSQAIPPPHPRPSETAEGGRLQAVQSGLPAATRPPGLALLHTVSAPEEVGISTCWIFCLCLFKMQCVLSSA